jgi:hypothetical protein
VQEVESIQWLLFENRIALLVMLGLTEFVVLWVWARWRTRRTRNAVFAGLVLSIVLLVVQTVVVTDRERIIALCNSLAAAVENGKIAAVAEHLAPDFRSDGVDRDRLLADLTRLLTRVHVEETQLSNFRVSFADGQAHAEFDAACRVMAGGYVEGGVGTSWRLTLRQTNETWQVLAIELVPTPFFPFSTLGDALHGY